MEESRNRLTPRASKQAELLRALAVVCELELAKWQLDDAIAQGALGLPPCGTAGPRAYTSNLDEAVTLVPENFSYELTFSAAGEGAMRRARLWDWRRGPLMIDPANEWQATAATLPLALCAAALKARATIAEQEQSSTKRGEANSPTLSKAGA